MTFFEDKIYFRPDFALKPIGINYSRWARRQSYFETNTEREGESDEDQQHGGRGEEPAADSDTRVLLLLLPQHGGFPACCPSPARGGEGGLTVGLGSQLRSQLARQFNKARYQPELTKKSSPNFSFFPCNNQIPIVVRAEL